MSIVFWRTFLMDGLHEARKNEVLMAYHYFAHTCKNRGICAKNRGIHAKNKGVFIAFENAKVVSLS